MKNNLLFHMSGCILSMELLKLCVSDSMLTVHWVGESTQKSLVSINMSSDYLTIILYVPFSYCRVL